MDSGDPTNSNRCSLGGCDDVFGPDSLLDISNVVPNTYKEPYWKLSVSDNEETHRLVTVQAVVEQLHVPDSSIAKSQAIETKQGVITALPRSRMERRMHPPALKPHMRSQSVPEQMLGPPNNENESGEMWMSSLSSWKSRRIRATSSERGRKALQEEVHEIETTRTRRKSKTYREIIEDKELREKELQVEWNRTHEPGQKEDERHQGLEKNMTDVSLGYGSDGEQNNNKEELSKTPTGNEVTVVDTIIPQTANSQYSSAPPKQDRSALSMSFHDKLIREREHDQEMAVERRDLHSKTRDSSVRKNRLSVGIMSRMRAFDSGQADVPKEHKPQTLLMRQRSLSRPFSEMTVSINQRPRSDKGFGFTVEGGVDQEKPIMVTQVNSGGPADLSELKAKDEIIAINNEKVKPFTNDDFMYCISQAVLSGNLKLKVRRYDNEGITVGQSTSRCYSDLIPTSQSDTASENQSSDPTDVISPSQARAMFAEMDQNRGTLSPDSQRSLSPKHHQSTPMPKSQQNHKPKDEPRVEKETPQENQLNQLENDANVHCTPYQEIQRVRICDPIPEIE